MCAVEGRWFDLITPGGAGCNPANTSLPTVAESKATRGPVGNAFNGVVQDVVLSIAEDPKNAGHLVSPEDVLRAALGRQ
jgi:hypothetical protein